MVINCKKRLEYFLVYNATLITFTSKTIFRVDPSFLFCSFNFLLTTNCKKIKINIILKSSLNISYANLHKLQTELNLNCSSNTKKSKEIIPLNIFKRKSIAFHIQWGRYKFDTRKVGAIQWMSIDENTNVHTWPSSTTKWLNGHSFWFHHPIDGDILQYNHSSSRWICNF